MPNAAVIGAGCIAREHLDCLRNLREAKVVAVCDLSPSLAEATAEEKNRVSHRGKAMVRLREFLEAQSG